MGKIAMLATAAILVTLAGARSQPRSKPRPLRRSKRLSR
jgi:hypothetical protein